MRRTRRCAITPIRADDSKYGSTPISTRRATAPSVSLVCRVVSTRWPVSAACTAISRGLAVADLADHDDVRVLAQHVRSASAKVSADLVG